MINKISFTGREECLTGSIKKAKKPVVNYFSDSTILPELKTKVNASAEEISSKKLNEAYKAAHAPYIDAPASKTKNEFIMPGQQIL